MSQQAWVNLIAIGVLATLIGAILAFILVSPRWQLVTPLFISAGVATAIFLVPPGIDGRDSFHVRLGVAILAALGVALVTLTIRARRAEPSGRDLFGVIAVSLFGVSLPVIAGVALIVAACSGGACD